MIGQDKEIASGLQYDIDSKSNESVPNSESLGQFLGV